MMFTHQLIKYYTLLSLTINVLTVEVYNKFKSKQLDISINEEMWHLPLNISLLNYMILTPFSHSQSKLC